MSCDGVRRINTEEFHLGDVNGGPWALSPFYKTLNPLNEFRANNGDNPGPGQPGPLPNVWTERAQKFSGRREGGSDYSDPFLCWKGQSLREIHESPLTNSTCLPEIKGANGKARAVVPYNHQDTQ